MIALALAAFAASAVCGADIADLKLKASTDKENPIDYAVGETIRFDFRLDGVTELPEAVANVAPLHVIWTRTGDDGVKTKGTNDISLAQGFSMETSLAVPGFVRVEAYLAKSTFGKFSYTDGDGNAANITFEGGAGADTRKMRLSTVEPVDFDQFWAEAKAKLATVPFDDTNVELEDVTPNGTRDYFTIYAAKIPCYGPRPVTGWLMIPKNVPTGGLPVQANFEGYGCVTAAPKAPTWGIEGQIRFTVNAHGYDLVGQDDQYYKDFNDSINKTDRPIDPSYTTPTRYSYGLAPSDYDNPTNTYFYYMAMRVMRAFDYLKSRPEWDGTNVIAEGGSQGGLQTMWAGGLVEGISQIKPSATWGCDIGNYLNKTGPFLSNTWGIPNVPGAYYFDAALHASRVPMTCVANLTRLGLGDTTCPSRGVLLSYYLMKCPATAKLVQGSTHGYIPPEPNQTFRLSKAAGAEAFSNVHVSDAPNQDGAKRLVTVTGVPAGAEVTVALAAVDGSPLGVTATATANVQGVAVVRLPIPSGGNFTYTVSSGGDVIGSGRFSAGGWNADGTWFRTAPDGQGGALEMNGAWTTPPPATNATAFVSTGDDMAFSLSDSALETGSNKFVRAEAVITYPQLNVDLPPPPTASFTESLAAVAAVTNAIMDGPSEWMAYVGGAWKTLSGGIAPAPGTTYTIRMEGDFTSPGARVRLSVSADGGTTFSTLADAATGDEWLVPTDAAKRTLGKVATHGAIEVGELRGELSNGVVAFSGTLFMVN